MIFNNMKHTFRTIVVAAMAVLTVAFVGCSKEENNNDSNDDIVLGTAPAVWVDLGLPSGLLWATCNVGATSPEEYGDLFAWGETTTKSVYDWSTYAYGNAYDQLTKYCSNSEYGLGGHTDNLTTLQPGDDAATSCMGNGARTPTLAEWEELINNTTPEWTTQNGINGRKFTAANGKSIFLPAAGERDVSDLDGRGNYGNYWSSSLHTEFPLYAWYFFFYSDYQYMNYYRYRSTGFSIRAVRAR